MPQNTYEALYSTTLGSAAPSVTFSSIPAGYTDLVLITSVFSTSVSGWGLNFNSDITSANYSYGLIDGDGTTASTNKQTSPGRVQIGGWSIATGSSTKPSFGMTRIFGYSNSTTFKPVASRSQTYNSTTGANVSLFNGIWESTAAITSMTISLDSGSMNFSAGSTFTLYGIKAWVTETSPKATGGYVYSDSSYWYHAFLSSSTFTPTTSLTADVLVVAGGGAGGGTVAGGGDGGGGGAGGVSYLTSSALTATGYAVTIGAGGSGQSGVVGVNGSNSVFNGITSIGGGGGGGNGAAGASGGSGGGGGANNAAGGSSTQGSSGGATGYGFAGGSSSNWAYNISGGGGAGSAGVSGNAASSTFTIAPNGGVGLNTWSSWLSAALVGADGYLAGGGAGGKDSTVAGAAGIGGLGGGGNGGVGTGALLPTTGRANTGGGGGGGGGNLSQAGANGGSGVVIIRYAK